MRGITKRFGNLVANEDIDLLLETGEVHGLLGENGAGKSTLMNILYGMTQPDSGSIEIDGTRVQFGSPKDAIRHGVGMVHQHFMLVPDMTVLDNVLLGLGRWRGPFLNRVEAAEEIKTLSEKYGLGLKPDNVVTQLSLGMRQRLEILKLLFRDVRVLVLDEPTAVLTPAEWKSISEVLSELAKDGRSIVLITHKLHELFGIVKRCTVLRDSRLVGTIAMRETDERELARMMVGREIVLRVEKNPATPGRPILELENVSTDPGTRVGANSISLEVRESEIVGIAGVDGNGQHELEELICGLSRPSCGSITIDGHRVDGLSVEERIRMGVASITSDRHSSGAALGATVLENLMLKEYRQSPLSRWGWLKSRLAEERAEGLIRDYDIRGASHDTLLDQLSGGNQQKVVLARELHREPFFLLAAQPTRGLDIGAMSFVYEQLLDARSKGCAILLISTELEEIFSLSDRIGVLVNGRLVSTLDAANADLETVGMLMAGGDTESHAGGDHD